MIAKFLASLITLTLEWNGECGASYDFTVQNPLSPTAQWVRMYPEITPVGGSCAFKEKIKVPADATQVSVRACLIQCSKAETIKTK